MSEKQGSNQNSNHLSRAITFIGRDEVRPLTVKPTLWRYVLETWARRHFILADARARSFNTGRDTYLGKIWLFLEPLMQVSVYFVIFGLILKTDRGIENYISYLIVGVIFFGFFSRGIASGSLLIQNNRRLISAFNFPCASIAISRTVRGVIDNSIPSLVAILLALMAARETPSLSIALIIPAFLIAHVFIAGTTLLIASVTALIPDLRSLVNFGNRALFFLSGVFFSIDRFSTHTVLLRIVEFNPIYQFLQLFRACIYGTDFPSVGNWIYLILWSIGTFILGFILFWSNEEKYYYV